MVFPLKVYTILHVSGAGGDSGGHWFWHGAKRGDRFSCSNVSYSNCNSRAMEFTMGWEWCWKRPWVLLLKRRICIIIVVIWLWNGACMRRGHACSNVACNRATSLCVLNQLRTQYIKEDEIGRKLRARWLVWYMNYSTYMIHAHALQHLYDTCTTALMFIHINTYNVSV